MYAWIFLTSMGEAMAGMGAVFAQLERRLMGQRTKEALAEKRAQGIRLGRPLLLSSDLRSRLRADYAKPGATYASIAANLNEQNVPTAHRGANCSLRRSFEDARPASNFERTSQASSRPTTRPFWSK